MWGRLWSTAVQKLRLTEQQFFKLTPRMFQLLVLRYEEEWERRELLNAIVSATVANYSIRINSADDFRDFKDFMPSQVSKRHKNEIEEARQAGRNILRKLKAKSLQGR